MTMTFIPVHRSCSHSSNYTHSKTRFIDDLHLHFTIIPMLFAMVTGTILLGWFPPHLHWVQGVPSHALGTWMISSTRCSKGCFRSLGTSTTFSTIWTSGISWMISSPDKFRISSPLFFFFFGKRDEKSMIRFLDPPLPVDIGQTSKTPMFSYRIWRVQVGFRGRASGFLCVCDDQSC